MPVFEKLAYSSVDGQPVKRRATNSLELSNPRGRGALAKLENYITSNKIEESFLLIFLSENI